MTENSDTPRLGRRSLVGPLILTAIGSFYLLSNLGLIAWSFWEVAVRLWPIAVIALGLDLLIGRRSTLGSVLVLLVTIALLGGGLVWLGLEDSGRGAIVDRVSQPLANVNRAEIEINFGAGDLHLTALPAAGPLLVEGTLDHDDRAERIEQAFDVSDGVAHYRLVTRDMSVAIPFISRFQKGWQPAFRYRRAWAGVRSWVTISARVTFTCLLVTRLPCIGLIWKSGRASAR